jgi:superfamily II DNA or RNA helicase
MEHSTKDDRLQAALEECRRLREEVLRLRAVLTEHALPDPTAEPKLQPATVDASILPHANGISHVQPPPDNPAKVQLFRSIFRGREDVYAIRWTSNDGLRSGYVPDSERDWDAWHRASPEDQKRVDKETRKLVRLTDAAVAAHLGGQKTIGIYPLLTNESCWFLAADFDKKHWEEDALTFVETCYRSGVAAYLERSRSGKGGHVWIFFERPVPAILARKLGCAMLTNSMDHRHQIGLDSYDRFFPNQDTMPKGGFGNLIALPLQRKPRDEGNSVFVDGNLKPYPDQWRLLSSINRVSPDQVEWISNDATRRNQVVGVRMALAADEGEEQPWTLPPSRKIPEPKIAGPFPAEVEAVQSNLVYVPKTGLPEALLNRIIRIAAFQNPEFYKHQAMRLNTWDKPRVIFCGQELAQFVAIPRGCVDELAELLEAHGIKLKLRDERCSGRPIAVQFDGTLRDEQKSAIQQILQHNEGILCAPTAFGKTVVASKIIAERGVNTLVLVHRQNLLDQWRERLSMFLGVPVKAIGQVSGGKEARTGNIDVALLQSCHRKGDAKDFVAEYGQVIVDECHHVTAFTFEQVMRQVKARFVVGLTATPSRKDGHQPILYMQCGPIRFSMSAKDAAARHPFEHLVLPRITQFRMANETPVTIQDVYPALMTAEERNRQIIDDIRQTISAGGTPLVLTSRVEHIERLAAGLADVPNVLRMRGGMGKQQRRAVAEQLAAIPAGTPRVIIATGSYIGEGFDDPQLDTLFLPMPISWHGTLQQYVGRLHRLHEGKREVRVYDYADLEIPMLARMYEKRMRGYRNLGYVVEGTSSEETLL